LLPVVIRLPAGPVVGFLAATGTVALFFGVAGFDGWVLAGAGFGFGFAEAEAETETEADGAGADLIASCVVVSAAARPVTPIRTRAIPINTNFLERDNRIETSPRVPGLSTLPGETW
jgi:hypothetical protein